MKQAPKGACSYKDKAGTRPASLFYYALPAGFHQAWYVTAHGGFAQLVTRQTELAINAVRTAGDAATVTQARGAGVTWLLLQRDLGFPTRFRTGVRISDGSFQLGTLLGVLLAQPFADASAHGSSCLSCPPIPKTIGTLLSTRSIIQSKTAICS